MKELDDNLIKENNNANTQSVASTSGETSGDKEHNIGDMIIICAVLETILAIPIMGGMIILSLVWVPLFVMFGLHVVTIVLISNNNSNRGKVGNIMGIIASVLGFVPFLGMILHIITAILLWIEVNSSKKINNK